MIGKVGGTAIRAVDGGDVLIEDCTFRSNRAGIDTRGGAGFRSGGAIYADGVTINITRSTFENNFAFRRAGGAIAMTASSTLVIQSCVFSGNRSDSGGGGAIYSLGALTVRSSLFLRNRTSGSGGTISAEDMLTVVNSTFWGNRTENSTRGEGGAIFFANNNTISLANNIFWSNNSENSTGHDIHIEEEASTQTYANNIVPDGTDRVSGATDFTNLSGITSMTAPGDIFASIDDTDEDNFLRLASGSPAANAGSNDWIDGNNANGYSETDDATNFPDVNGLSRVDGGAVDIGAYEAMAHSLTISENTVSVGAAMETATITVTFDNGATGYEVTKGADTDYITIPEGEQTAATFNIVVGLNGGLSRMAEITVTTMGDDGIATSQTITLTQAAADHVVTLNPDALDEVPAAGATPTIRVTLDGGAQSWTVVSTEPSWAMVPTGSTTGNGMFDLTITANAMTSARTATIRVTSDGNSGKTTTTELTFTQTVAAVADHTLMLGATMPASNVPSAGGAGEDRTFTVMLGGGATGFAASSDETWATPSPTTMTGGGTITVSFDRNPTAATRTATITVKTTNPSGGDIASDTRMITQEANCCGTITQHV